LKLISHYFMSKERSVTAKAFEGQFAYQTCDLHLVKSTHVNHCSVNKHEVPNFDELFCW